MTPTEQDNELEAAICKVMNIFPEELEYNLPNSFGKSELEAIVQLIAQQVLEARLDELYQAAKHINRGQRWDDYLDRAIEQMQSELKGYTRV